MNKKEVQNQFQFRNFIDKMGKYLSINTIKLLLLISILVFGKVNILIGQKTYYEDQKVKTTKTYTCFVDNATGWMYGFDIGEPSYTLSGPVTIAPGAGDPGFTDAIYSYTDCTWFISDGQLGIQFNITFTSLEQLGTWTVVVDGIGADPYYCAYNGCEGPTCYPQGLYELFPLTYIITVWNNPPTASPSHNPSPKWNRTVQLDANSSDPDGGSLSHSWSITNKPASSTATLSNPNTETPSITFSSENDIGEWSFRVNVDDNEGERKTFTHSFVVPNEKPNIHIEGNTNINAKDQITLSAVNSGSTDPGNDVDGGALTFKWEVLSAPAGGSFSVGDTWNTRTISFPTTEDDITTVAGVDNVLYTFKVTATDNEGDSDAAEIEVYVNNIPPEISFNGMNHIDIGQPIDVMTTILDDQDDGSLQFKWDIIQAPQSSSVPIQEGFSYSSSLTMNTNISYAGTWIFRLTATDNEGESICDDFIVLVDAPPLAHINGPDILGSFSFPLELSGEASIDPDSPCPSDPNRCHNTSDPPVHDISTGIKQYSWFLVDYPFELAGDYTTGSVDEVFGIPAHDPTLELTFGDIEQGEWTFGLEVVDGEDNTNYVEFTVTVVDENGTPFAIISPPSIYAVDVYGKISEDISLSGYQSFDLDNVLAGDIIRPGVGISDYSWKVVQSPAGCSVPILPSGSGAHTINIYNAGDIIDPKCQGIMVLELTVTDDDTPAKKGSAKTMVIIGNCPGDLCIDYPTTINPFYIEFAENTDIEILYHLNSIIYDDPVFQYGLISMLEIFYETESSPVFTSYDFNILSSDKGGFLVYHWNGYTNTNDRPRSGMYHVKITLLDYGFLPVGRSTLEMNSIQIEVVEPEILSTSSNLVCYDYLKNGREQVDLNYQIDGYESADNLTLRVLDLSESVVYESNNIPEGYGTIHWDGRDPFAQLLPAGSYELELEAYRAGISLGISNRYQLDIMRMDLDVDANRDNIIEDADNDDLGEEIWGKGIGTKGALVLANSDDDDGNHLPDNWAGGDFNYDGTAEAEDNKVNNDPDKNDLAPLILRKSGLIALPAGAEYKLRIEKPTSEPSFYSSIDAKDRARIFIPSLITGDNITIQAGDISIIGPTNGAVVEFTGSPSPSQQNVNLFNGSGEVQCGIEGIKYGSLLDVILEFYMSGILRYEDRVSMRVAPFILSNHTKSVSLTIPADKTVYIEDLGSNNKDLCDAIELEYTMGYLDKATSGGDPWHQDGYEIGYSKAPYGEMPVVFGLPRGARNLDLLNKYTRQKLLKSNVGIIHELQNIDGGDPADPDDGGNLECIPGSPEKFLYGDMMKSDIVEFLSAQGVQTKQPINTSFLAVGHVDEIVSYCPNGIHGLIASPDVAWALLIIANSKDPGAPMLNGMRDLSNVVSPGGTTVGSVVGNLTLKTYNIEQILSSSNLGKVCADLGIILSASIPAPDVSNTGSLLLSRAGGLIGFFPNTNLRTFKLTFTNDHEYNINFQEAGSATWTPDGTGDIANDIISSSRTAFLLNNWWNLGTPVVGDIFTFTVNPNVTWLEVPVLFRDYDAGKGLAYTNNTVNSLVDGARIITAQTFGPKIDLGTGTVRDIFESYMISIWNKAGYTNVVHADERATYHNYCGSIHCGTNVRRTITTTNWWE